MCIVPIDQWLPFRIARLSRIALAVDPTASCSGVQIADEGRDPYKALAPTQDAAQEIFTVAIQTRCCLCGVNTQFVMISDL